MTEYLNTIIKTRLFDNIDKKEIPNILNNFKSQKKLYEKGNIIIDMGDKVEAIYLILNGKIEISKEYDDTRKNIVNILESGEIFAEAMALSTNKISQITAISLSKSEILKINIKDIFDNNLEKNKNIFIENLLKIISDKNKFLSMKNDILSQKSLRSKIILYLEYMSNMQKSEKINIPYSRDKLAEFISADRSALSRELNRLAKEKMIELNGNKINIIDI
ncbi:Crp/Fnr family transcriptional regulator [Brachyspira aalborgi]|uniref:Crp/Fnr family transcriptional regulator n=1 Tax=Brachyspira aalborgi TaxID=29522 RepID=A0A5C8ETH9_9SPIR|nr:Crp/Fnr family transcriptional regulator [Brachyspira aalborgi]MBS4763786.1 Crp/Fnr family transcriptional regulator [Brachyspira sp.]TXJ15758.1 Crp/Fnr family transcriptional regulator [Brachyspira aalborgi]TXJ19031.1 Crp/Fnr family transcriptional regulator [Brachyspira aalborgi]TXJ25154.1 Crp/Fnr family transcriptional regulator [Brachyspira aalborgi]TXJ31069.1 Crp/Fnr family transcriptional regulator [Brachyspira aalborgi]